MSSDSFELVEPALPEGEKKTRKKSEKKPQPTKNVELGTEILSYRHLDKRVNNPEVGMVTPFTDPDAGKTRWKYDPHIDPSLQFDSQRAWTENLIDDALASNDPEQMKQALEALKKAQSPYLNWAGKAEHTSFVVDTVSLHVHERVDPASILAAVRKRMGKEEKSNGKVKALQPGLFDAPFENLPLRDALDFYKHEKGWSNRLIAGDSLLVMNSLLQKESMAGKVQMVYFDPPYGIKYGSNFQPFVNKKDVKDKSDNDLTQEPEMLKAFRDTWELGIHSYLTYMRDRLLLAKDLLNDTGSIFVQISDDNLHHIREMMDEVFGSENFVSVIAFTKAAGGLQASNRVGAILDYIVWYAKDSKKVKYNRIFTKKTSALDEGYNTVAFNNGYFFSASKLNINEEKDLPENADLVMSVSMTKPGPGSKFEIPYQGRVYDSGKRWWGTTPEGLNRVLKSQRAIATPTNIRLAVKFKEFPYTGLQNLWNGFGGAA